MGKAEKKWPKNEREWEREAERIRVVASSSSVAASAVEGLYRMSPQQSAAASAAALIVQLREARLQLLDELAGRMTGLAEQFDNDERREAARSTLEEWLGAAETPPPVAFSVEKQRQEA